MGALTIAQKAINGSHMYKCNITYRYGFILRWNPRIYNMCRQALAHEHENFNNFPCSRIFGDFRGFYMGGASKEKLVGHLRHAAKNRLYSGLLYSWISQMACI